MKYKEAGYSKPETFLLFGKESKISGSLAIKVDYVWKSLDKLRPSTPNYIRWGEGHIQDNRGEVNRIWENLRWYKQCASSNLRSHETPQD